MIFGGKQRNGSLASYVFMLNLMKTMVRKLAKLVTTYALGTPDPLSETRKIITKQGSNDKL